MSTPPEGPYQGPERPYQGPYPYQPQQPYGSPQQPYGSPPPPHSPKSKPPWLLIICIVLAVALVAAIVGVVAVSAGGSDDPKPVPTPVPTTQPAPVPTYTPPTLTPTPTPTPTPTASELTQWNTWWASGGSAQIENLHTDYQAWAHVTTVAEDRTTSQQILVDVSAIRIFLASHPVPASVNQSFQTQLTQLQTAANAQIAWDNAPSGSAAETAAKATADAANTATTAANHQFQAAVTALGSSDDVRLNRNS
jgi:hypothetical protein